MPRGVSACMCLWVNISMQTGMTKQISNLPLTKTNRGLNLTPVLLLLIDLLDRESWEKYKQSENSYMYCSETLTLGFEGAAVNEQ